MISHPISITFQRVPTHFMDSYDFASDFYLNSKGSYAFSIPMISHLNSIQCHKRSYAFSMDSCDFVSDFYSISKGLLCIFY